VAPSGERWHRPAGSIGRDIWDLVVTPESAGWQFSGLRVASLPHGGRLTFDTGEDEAILLPLSGSAVVRCDGDAIRLEGRRDPFAGSTDFLYAPCETELQIECGSAARFAIATARADERRQLQHGSAADVPVEIRGAGVCSREVRNFARPDTFDAQRLIAVEVITPSGNWSSYPPHKHDEELPEETVLEEIYYYEIARGPAGPGFGYQRVYGTPDRPIDLLAEVRDGDVVLIPHGWHGPAMAAPGYDMYDLNVMAGPGPERAWRITDDPDHAWVRDSWSTTPVDPRLTRGNGTPRPRGE
jgi:5-deoxy-glucuronate isomerase